MTIIDMPLPKSCSECELLYDCMYCIVTTTRIDFSKADYERLADCPLHEVKDNIRLIDAEALKQRIQSVFPMVYGGVASEIDDAPTIN